MSLANNRAVERKSNKQKKSVGVVEDNIRFIGFGTPQKNCVERVSPDADSARSTDEGRFPTSRDLQGTTAPLRTFAEVP